MPAVTQVVSIGIQDMSLVSEPEHTFWSIEYKRHTNFAMESIENNFQQTADFGRRASCMIQRVGDLAGRTYLQVTLPEITPDMSKYARWLDYIGEHLIAEVEILIGGQKIDRQFGEWIHIWNQLTLPLGQRKNYHKMIGHTTQLTYITDPDFEAVPGPCAESSGPNQVCAPRNALPETTLYVPLAFWFCLNPGLALPIIALPFHDIRIDVVFRPLAECLWAVESLASSDGVEQKSTKAYATSLVAASLYVDYIFLDIDERTAVANQPHSYLINQLQYNGDESVGSSTARVKLTFSHPTRALYFVIQPDANVDYCSSTRGGSVLYKTLGAQPFNYTDAIDALPRSIHAFGGRAAIAGNDAMINASGLFETAGAPMPSATSYSNVEWMSSGGSPADYVPFSSGDGKGSLVSDAGTFVLSETARDLHCWGENPVVTCTLKLNGSERMPVREGSYFDRVQPFQHHANGCDDGINMYSFALKPGEYAPSGALNFSRMDSAELALVISSSAVSGTNTAKARVYALNTNELQVTNGMAGLRFAS